MLVLSQKQPSYYFNYKSTVISEKNPHTRSSHSLGLERELEPENTNIPKENLGLKNEVAKKSGSVSVTALEYAESEMERST